MTNLRKRMLEELQRRNYSEKTIHSYLRTVEQFAKHFGKSPDKLGPDELRSYQAYLLSERKLAVGSVVGRVAALRFFFVRTLKRRDFWEELPYPKDPKDRRRLPTVLSLDEVARPIDAAGNLMQRALLMTLYGTRTISNQRLLSFDGHRVSLGISILNGRQFNDHDTSTAPAVAVINRALAQKEFSGKNPIGSSFQMKEGGPPIEIVGICADSKYAWIRQDDPPTFFVPYMQQRDVSGGMTFEIHTNGNPRSFVPAIREVVESIDKDLPLIDIRTQQEQIDVALAPERSFASVTTGFGVLALLLASIGIYGVMAAAVSRRVNEIGVRMALGARTNQVLRMILGEATALALSGVCIGLIAAFGLTRFLASFLYGLKPTDPLTFIASGVLLCIVAMLASWSPARRASRIQPVQALRHE